VASLGGGCALQGAALGPILVSRAVQLRSALPVSWRSEKLPVPPGGLQYLFHGRSQQVVRP